MAKTRATKRVPNKGTAPRPLTTAERLQAARRERRQQRELNALMRQIVRKRLDNDAGGVALARALVVGTEYIVMSELQVKQLEHDAREWENSAKETAAELAVAKHQLNPETV